MIGATVGAMLGARGPEPGFFLIGAVPAAQGVTVNVAMLLKPPSEAKTVTVVLAVTGVVGMENVTVLDPDAMVTLPGTGATVGLELASVASAPLLGGDALKVTVPVTMAPPLTLAGARLTLESPTTGCSLPQPQSSAATAAVSMTVPVTVDRFKTDLFLLPRCDTTLCYCLTRKAQDAIYALSRRVRVAPGS